MPYAGMNPSGTPSGSSTRPDYQHGPAHESDDLAPEMSGVNESLRPGALADLAVSQAEVVPRLAAGVELLGEYRGSGLGEVTFLARNASGRIVHLSRLLWLVLSGVDGCRSVGEIAARASAESGRSVSAANVEYLLANKLAPQGLVAGEGAGQPAVRPDPMILALKLRRTLLSEAGVQVVARLLAPLFSPLVVVAVLAALAGADVWLVRSGGMLAGFREVLARPLLLLVVLGLSLVSMVFHECGHAAACRYGGARPGRIGMGLYVLWPALFTNVTDSYRLGRAGRLRTDLGGVYFNAVFAVVLAGAYRVTGYLPLLVTAGLTQVELAEQLIPSLRLDGYFILTDLIGVPDLFQRIGPVLRSLVPGQPADPRLGALKRAARVALTAWVLAMVPLLGGELLLIVVGIPKLAAGFARSLAANADAVTAHFGRGEVAAGLVSVISVVLLIFPVAGIGYLLVLTGRAAVRLAAAATRKHRMLRLPAAAAAALAAAALAYTWGLLPLPGQPAAPRPAPGAAAAATSRPAMALGRPKSTVRAARPQVLLPSQSRGSVPEAVPVIQPAAYVSPPVVAWVTPTPSSPEPSGPPSSSQPSQSPSPSPDPSDSPSPSPSPSSSPPPSSAPSSPSPSSSSPSPSESSSSSSSSSPSPSPSPSPPVSSSSCSSSSSSSSSCSSSFSASASSSPSPSATG
jgi:putative peptide zinc metalloprotease protein